MNEKQDLNQSGSSPVSKQAYLKMFSLPAVAQFGGIQSRDNLPSLQSISKILLNEHEKGDQTLQQGKVAHGLYLSLRQ